MHEVAFGSPHGRLVRGKSTPSRPYGSPKTTGKIKPYGPKKRRGVVASTTLLHRTGTFELFFFWAWPISGSGGGSDLGAKGGMVPGVSESRFAMRATTEAQDTPPIQTSVFQPRVNVLQQRTHPFGTEDT